MGLRDTARTCTRVWSGAREAELAGRGALLLSFRFFSRVGEVLTNCQAFMVGGSLEAICAWRLCLVSDVDGDGGE